MSKAARIRELLAKGKAVREVAEVVGCSPEYVRVAGRQRTKSANDPERRWARTKRGRQWTRDYQKWRRDLRREERQACIDAMVRAGLMVPIETAPPATRG